jgi:hypothetical protein
MSIVSLKVQLDTVVSLVLNSRPAGFRLAYVSEIDEFDFQVRHLITRTVSSVEDDILGSVEGLNLINETAEFLKARFSCSEQVENHNTFNLAATGGILDLSPEKYKVIKAEIFPSINTPNTTQTSEIKWQDSLRAQDHADNLYSINSKSNKGWRGFILRLIGVHLPEKGSVVFGGYNMKVKSCPIHGDKCGY